MNFMHGLIGAFVTACIGGLLFFIVYVLNELDELNRRLNMFHTTVSNTHDCVCSVDRRLIALEKKGSVDPAKTALVEKVDAYNEIVMEFARQGYTKEEAQRIASDILDRSIREQYGLEITE